MMKKILMVLGMIACLGIASLSGAEKFKTKDMTLEISDAKITGIIDNKTGKNYIAQNQPSHILQVRLFKDSPKTVKNYTPTDMKWIKKREKFVLNFSNIGVKVTIGIKVKKTHVDFEVLEITPKGSVESLIWGPYSITINRTVGETVGVAYNKDFAIGIQALNYKTLGGSFGPRNTIDKIKVSGGDDKNYYEGISEVACVRHDQRFWGDTAWRTDYGARLQAFCRDRTKEIVFTPGWHSDIMHDGGLIGSKIALFGCPGKRSVILDTIGDIEVTEGIPHPVLADGKWNKKSPDTQAIFLANSCNGDNIDPYIAWAKETPVKAIYYDTPGPFTDFGEYRHFAGGDAKYQKMIDKIKAAGFWVGTLSLSNMLSGGTKYVQNGDSRLKAIGNCNLATDLNASANEILIKNPTPEMFEFKYPGQPNTVRIDHELIQYKGTSKSKPYKLTGCKRGAFNSHTAAHKAGTKAYKIVCNPLVGNAELNDEVAVNIAAYHSKYDVRIAAHDGIEFTDPEGHGDYSYSRFFTKWWNALPKPYQGRTIMAGSNAGHYMWHFVGRYEWGDEGGSFNLRSGNKKYRNMNQCFYYRNLLPTFLGQITITDKMTLDEAEWFFSLSAGFDAGYRVKIKDPQKLLNMPENKKIRQAMSAWENARQAKAFPKELIPFLQDTNGEFHIEQIDKNHWKLYPRPDIKNRKKLGKPIIIPVKGKLPEDVVKRFKPPEIKKYKVTATSEEAGHPANQIVDGLINLQSYWAANPYPQSVTIDLGKAEEIKGVHLWPFFTSKRYFQYTVEVSMDNKNWKQIVDMSKNTKTPTNKGDRFVLKSPVKCRYIKVNMLYHNQNKGVYLVEVKWF